MIITLCNIFPFNFGENNLVHGNYMRCQSNVVKDINIKKHHPTLGENLLVFTTKVMWFISGWTTRGILFNLNYDYQL